MIIFILGTLLAIAVMALFVVGAIAGLRRRQPPPKQPIKKRRINDPSPPSNVNPMFAGAAFGVGAGGHARRGTVTRKHKPDDAQLASLEVVADGVEPYDGFGGVIGGGAASKGAAASKLDSARIQVGGVDSISNPSHKAQSGSASVAGSNAAALATSNEKDSTGEALDAGVASQAFTTVVTDDGDEAPKTMMRNPLAASAGIADLTTSRRAVHRPSILLSAPLSKPARATATRIEYRPSLARDLPDAPLTSTGRSAARTSVAAASPEAT